jgi:hypothetical protein
MLNNLVRFYTPDGRWRRNADGLTPQDLPGFPEAVRTQYVRSGTSAMLGLVAPFTEVEVMVSLAK